MLTARLLRFRRLLLPCLALPLIGSGLGCNAHGGTAFRLNLFTERAAVTAANPGAMAVFESVQHTAAPLVERHTHGSRMAALTTHHHLHQAL